MGPCGLRWLCSQFRRRIADLTRQLADEASRIVTVQAEDLLQRVSRAA